MKEERESRLLVYVRHLSPMIPGKTVVESLKESADLILIRISSRKDYDSFPVIEG